MKVRCPACRNWTRWEDNPTRPFCSENCKARDLGNWATEQYRIPEAEEDDSGAQVRQDTTAASGKEES